MHSEPWPWLTGRAVIAGKCSKPLVVFDVVEKTSTRRRSRIPCVVVEKIMTRRREGLGVVVEKIQKVDELSTKILVIYLQQ